MYKCEQCEQEFKSKSGLSRHIKSCKSEKDEIVEEVVEVFESKTISDNIQRKINKLIDARKSTWDAEERNNIDLQIKKLKTI